MRKKIKIGDVFEIETKKGKAYLQYIKEAEDNRSLETSRVFYTLHKERPTNLEIVTKDDFFFMKFPLSKLGRRKWMLNIGKIDLPKNLNLPKYFRRENPFGKGWQIIKEGSFTPLKVISELSEEQKKYSPSGMWSLDLLQENLENGWKVENWV